MSENEVTEVIELINEICDTPSVPKNVKASLEQIQVLFHDEEMELGVKVDSAMQSMEDLSLDPNLSSFSRAQIWNLTSLLEGLLK